MQWFMNDQEIRLIKIQIENSCVLGKSLIEKNKNETNQ